MSEPVTEHPASHRRSPSRAAGVTRAHRRRHHALLLAVTLLIALVVPASADDVFPEVPNSSPHHDAVSDIAGAGITDGCRDDPPRFCPGAAVERDQMASFLSRGSPRATYDHSVTTLTDGSGVPVTVTVDAPGQPGGEAFVTLQGSVSVYAEDGAAGCPCEVEAYLLRADDEATGPSSWATLPGETGSAGGTASTSLPVTWAVPIASDGRERFEVAVFVDGASDADVRAEAGLTATTAPFGEVVAPGAGRRNAEP